MDHAKIQELRQAIISQADSLFPKDINVPMQYKVMMGFKEPGEFLAGLIAGLSDDVFPHVISFAKRIVEISEA